MAEATSNERDKDFRGHASAAWHAWRESWQSLVPEKFREKGKEAGRESLLAMRSLIDCAIEQLDARTANEASNGPKPKIRVDDDEG